MGGIGIEGGEREARLTTPRDCILHHTGGCSIRMEIPHSANVQTHLVPGLRRPAGKKRVRGRSDFAGWLGSGIALEVIYGYLDLVWNGFVNEWVYPPVYPIRSA